jgi:hypothetical protein
MATGMKPRCTLVDDGRGIVAVLLRVNRVLREAGLGKQADEFLTRARACPIYEEMVRLAREYVEIE